MLERSTLIKIAKLIPQLNSHSEIDIAAALSGDNADARVQTLLRRCRDVLNRVNLQPYEAKFINSVIENYELNPDWAPSEKQWRWMVSLFNRTTPQNGGKP